MNMTVPTLSIAFIIISMVAGAAIPIVLMIFFRKKFSCDFGAFAAGCGVMLLFAFILEQIVHSLVLTSPIGEAITASVWKQGLYGGFMAGLFEESGRLIAFKTVLKNKMGNDHNALMYGAGHGGLEAFVILTIGMSGNLVYSVMMNSGNAQALTTGLSGDTLTQVQQAMNTLATTASPMFLVSILERGAAVILQISLSVLVWFAVKKGGKMFWLYPLAIALHMAIDTGSVILAAYVPHILLVELYVYILAIAVAVLAWKIFQKEKNCTVLQP